MNGGMEKKHEFTRKHSLDIKLDLFSKYCGIYYNKETFKN